MKTNPNKHCRVNNYSLHYYYLLLLWHVEYLTRGGPSIMPFQSLIVMSSSLSKPQLIVPSPPPFCPSSNSSSNLKFLGTNKKEDEE